MKVSLNAARSQSSVELMPEGVDDLVRKIGGQLGAVEEVVDYRSRYAGIVTARVVKCENHPDADKLSVCLIDDQNKVEGVERSSDGYVQVVCGAPNVREGLMVVWLPPGTTVPATVDNDPFTLQSRELRGVVSNGMLASAQELGISSDHSGLLEISEEDDTVAETIEPGTAFERLFGVDDIVLDIENKMFTHRPDCFGVLGVAREVAGIYGQAFTSPDWYMQKPAFASAHDLDLEVRNTLPDLVPRFMAVAMSGAKVKPSPIWLQAGLTRVGIKPINNVVDVTNYLSYVTGQPLHAYDYDKVASLSGAVPSLNIRFATDGETIALLNGKTIEPRKEAIMIASDQKLIGIGGVMGGKETEVDATTSNIIIECANFDMYSVRRTSMMHGLFTDAVTRNTKGQSPLQTDRVIKKALDVMTELTGARQASPVIDDKHMSTDVLASDHQTHQVVSASVDFINERLGLALTYEEIERLLTNVEFTVKKHNGLIEIGVPFWRTDIALPEDIVEEVGRLNGFENLPLQLPLRSISPASGSSRLMLKNQLRNILSSSGANELLTYTFVHANLLEKSGQRPERAFRLMNALSPELQHYRLSLTPGLLAHIHPNIKAGYTQFALYEINKTHSLDTKENNSDVPDECDRLALVLADKNSSKNAYFQARAYLDEVAKQCGLTLSYQPLEELPNDQYAQPYDPCRSALVTLRGHEKVLGIIGEFTASVTRHFKLPQYCAGFEIDLDAVESAFNRTTNYRPLSRYPSISQDICLETSLDVPFGILKSNLETAINESLSGDLHASFHVIDIYADDSIGSFKRTTFNVVFSSYERTLTEQLASKSIDNIVAALTNVLDVQRV